MKKSPVVTGLTVAGITLALTLVGTGGASAETLSELSVDPIEPSTASVCWTPYIPAPGSSVTRYRLTTKPGGETFLFPDETAPGPDGRYCRTENNYKSGKKYSFKLEAQIDNGGYVDATSPTTITTSAYSLSASYSRTAAKHGQKIQVSGVLKSSRTPKEGAAIIVQQKLKPSDQWIQLGDALTTDENGQYDRTIKVKQTVSVRTYFAGTEGEHAVGAWSSATRIDVSPVFSLSFNKNPVKLGKTVTAKGKVAAGNLEALAGDSICLQKKEKGSWRGVGIPCVEISAEGRFSARFTPQSKADLFYRWRATSVAPEYVAGNSPKKRLTVK